MARFENSREGRGNRDSRSAPRRSSGDGPRRSFGDGPKRSFGDGPRRSYGDGPRGRSSDRESDRGSRNRRDFVMTKVTCSDCGASCEVPFKPTSSKPVYCDACFSKKDNGGSSRNSHNAPNNSEDFNIIKEKLNKIMKALKIDE